jgi:hypothetical protein
MRTAPSRQRRPQALRELMATPAASQAIRQSCEPLPGDVTRYLGRLSLLHELPFTVVVPDSRMLPPESIRFFFLDQNWLDALLDGALSVVDLTGQDQALLDLLRPGLRDQVRAAAATQRSRRRGAGRMPRPPAAAAPEPGPGPGTERVPGPGTERVPGPGTEPVPGPGTGPGRGPGAGPAAGAGLATGFLLRSSLVSDWPGLHVTAFADAAGTQPLAVRRLDRVAPSVLIAIVAGRAQQVRIAKPPQGLHYGAIQDGPNPRDYRVYLRGLGGKFPAGPQLPGDPSVVVPMRAGPAGRAVLDIAALHADVADGVAAAYAPGPAPPVDPGAFGLELIAGAELQVFVPDPQAAPGGGQR